MHSPAAPACPRARARRRTRRASARPTTCHKTCGKDMRQDIMVSAARQSGGRGFESRPAHPGLKKMSTEGSWDVKVTSREAFSVFCTSHTSSIVASSQDKGREECEADGGERGGAVGPQVRGNGRGVMCGGVGSRADLQSRSTTPSALKVSLLSDADTTPAVKGV